MAPLFDLFYRLGNLMLWKIDKNLTASIFYEARFCCLGQLQKQKCFENNLFLATSLASASVYSWNDNLHTPSHFCRLKTVNWFSKNNVHYKKRCVLWFVFCICKFEKVHLYLCWIGLIECRIVWVFFSWKRSWFDRKKR